MFILRVLTINMSDIMNIMITSALCITSVQCSAGGVQYTGGYHQYIGGYHQCIRCISSLHGGYIISALGNIVSAFGVFSALEDYHECIGGKSLFVWGISSVH